MRVVRNVNRNRQIDKAAAMMDPVRRAVREHEHKGEACNVGEWISALRFSANYNTVLAVGTPEERLEWATRFVQAAPVTPVVHVAESAAKLLTGTWAELMPYTDLDATAVRVQALVVEKLAELTGQLFPHPPFLDMIYETELDFLSAVHRFYYETFKYSEQRNIYFTVFHVAALADDMMLKSAACDNRLPTEVIERYAFRVPCDIAEYFVDHPNTPSRLRTLIQVALPHMNKT